MSLVNWQNGFEVSKLSKPRGEQRDWRRLGPILPPKEYHQHPIAFASSGQELVFANCVSKFFLEAKKRNKYPWDQSTRQNQ